MRQAASLTGPLVAGMHGRHAAAQPSLRACSSNSLRWRPSNVCLAQLQYFSGGP